MEFTWQRGRSFRDICKISKLILVRQKPWGVPKLLVRQVLPLFFADANGQEPVEGRTRFQKMLFVLKQENPKSKIQYFFFPYDYGPYSPTLQSDLDGLINQEYLLEEMFGDKYPYTITDKGNALVRHVLGDFKMNSLNLTTIYESCKRLKDQYNHLKLDDLLREIYSRYPAYAKSSIYQF